MTKSKYAPAALAVSLALLMFPSGALVKGRWASPGGNVPLCTATGDQTKPRIVADGAGGAFVTWQDRRSGGRDVYLHHIGADGVADPGWPKNGLAVCTDSSDQHDPLLAADGQGGAIAVWLDARNHGTARTASLYAQHALTSGLADSTWPQGGRLICLTAADENMPAVRASEGVGGATLPTLVTDGTGGAIVAWIDARVGSDHFAMCTQHILAGGSLDPDWPAEGRVLRATIARKADELWPNALDPVIASDGTGGAFVAWSDRYKVRNVLYVQHVLASGELDGRWPANGLIVWSSPGDQDSPALIADGGGHVIVAWAEVHEYDWDIYAQHVLASGTIDPTWPARGCTVCARAENQLDPALATDGAAGAIVTWIGGDYAHHVLAGGALDPVWPAEGRQLCGTHSSTYERRIVIDGDGGAIVIWSRIRYGLHLGRGGLSMQESSSDLLAQHVTRSGGLDPNWPADGAAVSSASGLHYNAEIVSDGSHGAMVAWCDSRSGKTGKDIYAQHIQTDRRSGR